MPACRAQFTQNILASVNLYIITKIILKFPTSTWPYIVLFRIIVKIYLKYGL